MKDRKRIDECIKFGIVDTIIVSLMITLLFELLAHPLSQLFGLSGSTQEMIDICSTALHIASLGFVFMGISVAIQGVLQSIGYAIRLGTTYTFSNPSSLRILLAGILPVP